MNGASSFALHLLRHGEPEGAGRLIGATDATPTPAGLSACVDQGRDLGAEVLIASDLSRARLAGEAIASETGVPLSIDPRWRELDFGTWDGLAPGDVDGAALARFWDDPDAYAPPEAETWSTLVRRVGSAIGSLAVRPTLVVTHGGAMRAALAVLCGFGQRQTWALDLPYGCVLSLRVWPGDGAGQQPAAQIARLYP
ncbi:phosphoglycerate mutase family protein [Caenibius tardaugens NBRC 16725]|uniref:Phosphoglycerate mutase family protein n=1 Tax=Caenibius tardaugens NBRC 16725 TaxID=1219035 RepID=U2YLV7_9SPHN|nr:histidine phosphatase family protein [Caenibius tardaugens]AZI37772.1 histidine phosphatase family protein [Caenibius tardaugens NBRC 16725]GAD49665.1 phosphoglycerate mutase family protein [Caenibius tardaugens NBRC 16725]